MSKTNTKPKRHVRMFKPQFAELVRSGAKCQTVRPVPKRMPKAGDLIDCRMWTGKPYRSKQEKILEATIIHVHAVTVFNHCIMHIGSARLTTCDQFAQADGFKGFSEMRDWFADQHRLPFEGIVIYWKGVE
jgi:hypothetical protein